MATIFESPWSFTYHVGKDIIVNGVNIFKDIEAAISDGDRGDDLNMGRDIGKALALLILGEGFEFDGAFAVDQSPLLQQADDILIVQ